MTMKKRYIPPAFQTVAFSPNSPLCASGEIWNGSDITDPTENGGTNAGDQLPGDPFYDDNWWN